MRCERCGAANHDAATSCGNCGSALGGGASDAGFVAVAIASLVLVVGVIVALTILSGSGDDGTVASAVPTTEPVTGDPATTDPTTSAPATTAAATTAPATTPTTVATTTTAPPDPNEEAAAALAALVESDRPTIDGFIDRWVPQISAKTDGTEWEGVVYDHVRILNEHDGLRDAYGAVLASGAEYNFLRDGTPMVGWYFTLVPEPSPDAQGALDWCAAEGIDRDNCAAKLISNDRSIVPNFELQP